jgi:hypothetical protein
MSNGISGLPMAKRLQISVMPSAPIATITVWVKMILKL